MNEKWIHYSHMALHNIELKSNSVFLTDAISLNNTKLWKKYHIIQSQFNSSLGAYLHPKWGIFTAQNKLPLSFLSFFLRIHFNISFIIRYLLLTFSTTLIVTFFLLFSLSVAFTTFSNIYLHARILRKISEPFIPEFFELFRNCLCLFRIT